MISAIVATDLNNCIGNSKSNKIPWYCPEDLEWFKGKTMDHVVLMGRKTWDSLPAAPLKHRINIIVSKSVVDSINSVKWQPSPSNVYPHPRFTNVFTAQTPVVALNFLKKNYTGKDIFVIGGSTIFKWFFDNDILDEIFMTRMNKVYVGDIFLPALQIRTEMDWRVDILSRGVEFDRFHFVRNRNMEI